MSDHARYSPSQLPRIIGCPGSTSVHKSGDSSTYAEEGTLCHEIVADHLVKRVYDLDEEHKIYMDFSQDLKIQYSQPIQDCLDYAKKIILQYEGIDTVIYVEQHVTCKGFSKHFNQYGLNDVAGTCDLIIMVPSLGIIHIIDWKFGVGEVLPESEQLKAYGLGALQNMQNAERYRHIHLHIGQPRVYSGKLFKEHETTAEELLDWAWLDLVPALELCEGSDPPFKPSDKACQWCSIKAICTHRYDLTMKKAEEVFKVHAELPNIKSVADLAAFLVRARSISSHIKDIEGFLARTLKNGHEVPGLKMVETSSNRQWKDKKAVVQWANKNVPEAEIFDTELLSPSKLSSLVRRKWSKTEEFQALIYKPDGKHTMVPDTDPRKAVEYRTAGEVFADFVNEDD